MGDVNLRVKTGEEAAAVLDLTRTGPIEAIVGADRSPILFARFVGLWGVGLGLIALASVTIPHPPIPGLHATIIRVFAGGLLVDAIPLLVRPSWFPPSVLRVTLILSCPVMVILLVWSLGPRFEVGRG